MNYFWEAGGVAGFAGAGVEGVADVAAGAVAGVEAAGGVVVVGAAGGVVGAGAGVTGATGFSSICCTGEPCAEMAS